MIGFRTNFSLCCAILILAYFRCEDLYLAVTVVVTVWVTVLMMPAACEAANAVTGRIVNELTDEAVAPPDDTGVAGGRGAGVVAA